MSADRFAAGELSAERRRTLAMQADAADPSASAWVSANAGTGKTHVLTMRVLRLLLAGTPPDRILCLTYTKAAAAEMSQRIFQRLSTWVTPADDELAGVLSGLLGRPPNASEAERARQLFAQTIETPGGLKVQTIHAFCERLLQRFPLEAEVPPHFAILDEEASRGLQRRAIDEVLVEATRDGRSTLAHALNRAVTYAVDDHFDELLRDALGRRDWLEAAGRLDADDQRSLAAAEALYRVAFRISQDASIDALDREMASLLSDEQLVQARDVLSGGSTRDAEMSVAVAAVLRAREPHQKVDTLRRVFLTGESEPRKSLLTRGLAAEHPDIHALLHRAQDSFETLYTERSHLAVVEATIALMRLAGAVMQRYAVMKGRRAALDFDDLIRKTANLLRFQAGAEWVLYKLDGGLDHILVDEAQDTSPAQWSIIEALAEEFFSGTGARGDVVRTVFAVGDEKQSIYGFQGARPEMFARMGRTFAELATAANRVWRHVPLTLSFRSVAPLLAAVDAVFGGGARTPGVGTGAGAVRHIADRLGHAGRVEVWDTAKSDGFEPADVWAPLDERSASSPVVRLAARIADTIQTWLERGERLTSENRPVQAGDILILVRKRQPFAETMVAALKMRGIPVAGADRLKLTEQIAVQDVMAVGDFILLPEDDLMLATVLKSPFFDLDDDDLLAIAPDRKGSLWSALLAAANTSPRLQEAADTLKRWRARAGYAPPFEFFAEILDRDGGRRRLLRRLGPEACDPIDELLDLALKYDDESPPSLQGFLGWLRRSDLTIKRDMEHGRGEVRVMTVHGAKGLEAPIVFLPDTCTTRSGERPGGLLGLPGVERPLETSEPFCWPFKGTSRLAGVHSARQVALARDGEERNRLLYVAMTRARDRLYVAGFEGARGRERDCWYDLICDALCDALVEVEDGQGRRVRRSESTQEAEPGRRSERGDRSAMSVALPDWASRPPPRERGMAFPLAPSRLAPLETDAAGDPVDSPRDLHPGREPPSPTPAMMLDGQRFLRGTLTHALLQHLPRLERGDWEAAAQRFVAIKGAPLSPQARAGIVAETLTVLRDPAFARLFGPDSRAEVPIVAEIEVPGRRHTLRLAGQIDRLVRSGHEVLIVDYKTNRPPPLAPENVAEAYTLQLAAYRLAVQRIFGQARVRAALLWTDGPRIMEIPAAMLDVQEARLLTLERGGLDA